MRKYLIWVALLYPLCLLSQGRANIFEQNVEWSRILMTAKTENKSIFVVFNAASCLACQTMQNSVYNNDLVVKYMKERFVSSMIELDSSFKNSENLLKPYCMLNNLLVRGHVSTFPIYLFLSPSGTLLHEDVGKKDVSSFLSMVDAALDSHRQYYSLISIFNKHVGDFDLIPTLVYESETMGFDSIAEVASRSYMFHHLTNLPISKLWTVDNIQFIDRERAYIDVNDSIFCSYFRNRLLIDSVVHTYNFASSVINYIIYRDLVAPAVVRALQMGISPKWSHLKRGITRPYNGFYAAINVLEGEMNYRKAEKQWARYISSFIRRQQLDGIEELKPSSSAQLILNNAACEVFEYSIRKRELRIALKWSDLAIHMVSTAFPLAEDLDTKANLLYKLGKRLRALDIEKQAYDLMPMDKAISSSYEKMKSGLPTWTAE